MTIWPSTTPRLTTSIDAVTSADQANGGVRSMYMPGARIVSVVTATQIAPVSSEITIPATASRCRSTPSEKPPPGPPLAMYAPTSTPADTSQPQNDRAAARPKATFGAPTCSGTT